MAKSRCDEMGVGVAVGVLQEGMNIINTDGLVGVGVGDAGSKEV